MKKIINGKKYDTETAKFLASYEHSYRGQFEHYREELYQKRTGEFFLYGIGGPASKYSVQDGLNSWSGGEAISPLSYNEARKWAEERLEADEYEGIFGKVEESLDTISATFSLPKAVVDLIKREAEKTGKSKSQIVSDLVIGVLNT
jgi:hypothetical protein